MTGDPHHHGDASHHGDAFSDTASRLAGATPGDSASIDQDRLLLPGSPQAAARGCRCPILANAFYRVGAEPAALIPEQASHSLFGTTRPRRSHRRLVQPSLQDSSYSDESSRAYCRTSAALRSDARASQSGQIATRSGVTASRQIILRAPRHMQHVHVCARTTAVGSSIMASELPGFQRSCWFLRTCVSLYYTSPRSTRTMTPLVVSNRLNAASSRGSGGAISMRCWRTRIRW